jgi:hypothetical protein
MYPGFGFHAKFVSDLGARPCLSLLELVGALLIKALVTWSKWMREPKRRVTSFTEIGQFSQWQRVFD